MAPKRMPKALVRSVTGNLEFPTGEGDVARANAALKIIAHPLRLKILALLSRQEHSVQEILDVVGTTQSNVSQHLAKMRNGGLLDCRPVGNLVFYRIKDPAILRVVEVIHESFRKPCGRAASNGPTSIG